ncbi:hypothetical protein N483_23795 [Pseudoalteromonas luteoviolacea NCIMB 1944]|uniref:Uncharacterized protein n=2 Tax=Pseudoalteromonas TaxID=53246 RepID=V4HRM3_PSEL2|nr:hypothetical protein PL2TA16_04216 [Pseudoalteromonas luteoviolacea 2ta16]KZN34968.1 hypothetical protein N483_23795 [Pseudoalteromonas luteoviolacea NCIMB 1944]
MSVLRISCAISMIIALVFVYSYDWVFMSLATISCCFGVLLLRIDNINAKSIAILILAMSLFEFTSFNYLIPLESDTLPMIWLGTIVYGVQFTLFLSTSFLLLLRVRLTKHFFNQVPHVAPTYAEGLIAFSLFLTAILMALMLIENLLRNAIDLGFNNDFFGVLTKLTIIYDSYEIIAYTLRAILCALLISMLFVVEIDTSKLQEPAEIGS